MPIHSKNTVPISSNANAAFQQLPAPSNSSVKCSHIQNSQPPQIPKPQRALTNIILLQPGQRIDALARKRLARDIQLTIPVDAARGAEELDARLDQAGQPEHEEDEGAQDDDAGEEHPL